MEMAMVAPKRKRQFRRSTLIATFGAALLMLGGCVGLDEEFPPEDDHCEEIGRALTDQERKISGLLFAYDNKFLDFFEEYKKNYIQIKKREEKREIVISYLQDYPDCCAVLAPEFVRFNGWVSEYEAPSWNRDVVFAEQAKYFGQFHPKMETIRGGYRAYKISACGITTKINRG
jgi:hypothetical protein